MMLNFGPDFQFPPTDEEYRPVSIDRFFAISLFCCHGTHRALPTWSSLLPLLRAHDGNEQQARLASWEGKGHRGNSHSNDFLRVISQSFEKHSMNLTRDPMRS